MFVELCIYGQRIRAMVDTGASRSVLRRDAFDKLCKLVGRIPVLKKAVRLCGVTGHDINVLGSTEIADDEVGPFSVVIVEGIGHVLILGRDVLQPDGAQIDYGQNFLSWRSRRFNLLPSNGKNIVASLGDRPPLMEDSEIRECVQQNSDLFAARGEAIGCHPEIAVRIPTEGPPIKRPPL